MYFADIVLVIFNSSFLIQTYKTYIELDPGTGKKKVSRKWYGALSLDRLAEVQNSANSTSLGQCSQLVSIKDVHPVCAPKICPWMCAENCDQSYSIRLKISNQSRRVLATRASYV